MRTNIQYYPHSEINSLDTSNATLPTFCHAQLTGYSTGTNKVVIKLVDLIQLFGPPLPCQKYRNYTGLSVTPSYLLYFCVILKLDSQKIWKIAYLCKRINNLITNVGISIIDPFNATLPALSHDRRTG